MDGSAPLWLLEELCDHMELSPGMKVLDMGCGKGLPSVFLAKEYGVTVFANDLWISATENLRRFESARVALPKTLEKFWVEDMFTSHSGDWWKRHWEKTGLVEITIWYDIDAPKSYGCLGQREIRASMTKSF
ncbi:SAM-dependent methyltransferase [Paenibacillus dendritiformis]|uniref:SAM-dependent methyltransferase n=1 Tax=Paenibacillus dendritiformis TaxID=130049 RepID=UPI0015EC3EFE|nr:class I SAM-dependent methyltransferase [Paenibacillus dendritiformis]